MALAHSGGPLIVLFLPTVLVLMLFGSGAPLGGAPEWLFLSICVVAQFLGYLIVVHAIRHAIHARRNNAG